MASYATKLRQLYPYKAPTTSIDHLVIGGGVVGLSVAAGLVNTCGKEKTTFLVERRGQLGQETTNSEVIHSVGSLKSRLCVQSRQMLYERCEALDLPFRKTQKLIVATSNSQIPFLDKLSTLSQHPSFRLEEEDLGPAGNDSIIPCYFLSPNEALDLEPDLSRDVKGALLVTETGIIDSQALVDSLALEIEDPDYLPSKKAESSSVGRMKEETRGEGVLVMGTRVVRIDKDPEGKGWIVQMETGWSEDGEKGQVESVKCQVVVNAAGLGAASLLEGIVPEQDQPKMYLVKGNYMSYKGPGVSNVSRLIYPCPGGSLDHLGTHLTLDLDGNIRFGPDIEPIGSPSQYSQNPDFWQEHLAPSDSHLASIAEAVQDYLPGIDPAGLSPDYSGIRPNISPPGSAFTDFMIRHDTSRKGLIELLGFNSPGLTSSLATGEHVARMVRKEVWGMKVGRGEVESLADGWE